MTALFRPPVVLLRECEICERMLGAELFTDERDRSICRECWAYHDDVLVPEAGGRGDA